VKTGRWAGVVTAFITMSNVKDEIDWEFPGNATTQGQTNYFWQGVIRELLIIAHQGDGVEHFPAPTTNGQTEGNLTDTYGIYHEYTVRKFLNVKTKEWNLTIHPRSPTD
jgi:beta-glucanase (GH16 family)